MNEKKPDTVILRPKAVAKDTLTGQNDFVFYRVQISMMPAAQNIAGAYNNIKYNIIREPTPSKNIRITAGNFYTWSEVKAARDSIRRSGYKDAFIVEYHNGKRTREIYK